MIMAKGEIIRVSIPVWINLEPLNPEDVSKLRDEVIELVLEELEGVLDVKGSSGLGGFVITSFPPELQTLNGLLWEVGRALDAGYDIWKKIELEDLK